MILFLRTLCEMGQNRPFEPLRKLKTAHMEALFMLRGDFPEFSTGVTFAEISRFKIPCTGCTYGQKIANHKCKRCAGCWCKVKGVGFPLN